jgi:hypothetical protein
MGEGGTTFVLLFFRVVFVNFICVRAFFFSLLHNIVSLSKKTFSHSLSFYIVLLSIPPPFLLLPIIGTVELGYGTPYLLSLGIPKTLTPLVWLAGPLSGLIIQPVVGVFSDSLDWKMGRRRPFILIGAALTVMSMYMVAYAKEIAQTFVGGRGGKDGRATVGPGSGGGDDSDNDTESAVSHVLCLLTRCSLGTLALEIVHKMDMLRVTPSSSFVSLQKNLPIMMKNT